jgi:hypothetical protein
MMKKLTIVFLFVSALAASAQESIKTDFQTYTDLLIKKDFDKALGYMNDGLFKIVPKAQLVEIMEQTFNSQEIEIDMRAIPVLSDFSEAKSIEGLYYVKFKTKSVMKMKFNSLYDSLKSDDEKKTMLESVKQALNTQFGPENVSYDAATRFFTLNSTKPVIASSADKKKWKFVTVDSEAQKPMLEKFIPKELLD